MSGANFNGEIVRVSVQEVNQNSHIFIFKVLLRLLLKFHFTHFCSLCCEQSKIINENKAYVFDYRFKFLHFHINVCSFINFFQAESINWSKIWIASTKLITTINKWFILRINESMHLIIVLRTLMKLKIIYNLLKILSVIP